MYIFIMLYFLCLWSAGTAAQWGRVRSTGRFNILIKYIYAAVWNYAALFILYVHKQNHAGLILWQGIFVYFPSGRG